MTATHAPAEALAAGPIATEPNPATIMQLASGFMAAKHLFAASELGLFEALADSPANLDALAARTGLTRRAARISADAMVALGCLNSRTAPTATARRPLASWPALDLATCVPS